MPSTSQSSARHPRRPPREPHERHQSACSRADQAEPPPVPQAHVRKSGFSFVWLLPIVAAIVGAYLAFTTLSQRGPEIVDHLQRRGRADRRADQGAAQGRGPRHGHQHPPGAGHEPRHRLASHEQRGRPVSDRRARFWVVRPRLSASNISGLETLISGGYIEMDPGDKGGKSQREFTGLENPPGVRSDEPGTTFVLTRRRSARSAAARRCSTAISWWARCWTTICPRATVRSPSMSSCERPMTNGCAPGHGSGTPPA